MFCFLWLANKNSFVKHLLVKMTSKSLSIVLLFCIFMNISHAKFHCNGHLGKFQEIIFKEPNPLSSNKNSQRWLFAHFFIFILCNLLRKDFKNFSQQTSEIISENPLIYSKFQNINKLENELKIILLHSLCADC